MIQWRLANNTVNVSRSEVIFQIIAIPLMLPEPIHPCPAPPPAPEGVVQDNPACDEAVFFSGSRGSLVFNAPGFH